MIFLFLYISLLFPYSRHIKNRKAPRSRVRKRNKIQRILQTYGLALLFADTDRATSTAGRLSMLTTYTQTPVVAQTAVRANLLQAFEVLAQLAVYTIWDDLVILAVRDVSLSVEEPCGNFILGWALDDGDDSLEFFRSDFSSSKCKSSKESVSCSSWSSLL